MNFVESRKFGHAEEEFLWAPYSVFTVEEASATADSSTHWQPLLNSNPDLAIGRNYLNPYVLTMSAAIDNCFEAEDLPLAPWY